MASRSKADKFKGKRAEPRKKLRYGFIGAGRVVGRVSAMHIRHLAARDEVELVALVNVNTQAMAILQEKYDFQHRYTDYRQMLRESGLGAVSVCT